MTLHRSLKSYSFSFSGSLKVISFYYIKDQVEDDILAADLVLDLIGISLCSSGT